MISLFRLLFTEFIDIIEFEICYSGWATFLPLTWMQEPCLFAENECHALADEITMPIHS